MFDQTDNNELRRIKGAGWPDKHSKTSFMQLGFYLRMNVDAFKSKSQLIYWNTEFDKYTLIKRDVN